MPGDPPLRHIDLVDGQQVYLKSEVDQLLTDLREALEEAEAENWRRMEHASVDGARWRVYRDWIQSEVFEGRIPRALMETLFEKEEKEGVAERTIRFPRLHGTYETHGRGRTLRRIQERRQIPVTG